MHNRIVTEGAFTPQWDHMGLQAPQMTQGGVVNANQSNGLSHW